MNFRSLPLVGLVALALVASATAHIGVASDTPSGTYAVGDSFDVNASVYFHCTDADPQDPDHKATIANKADFAFLSATETDVSYDITDCQPNQDDPLLTTSPIDFTTTVTIDSQALAFEDYELQPGLSTYDGNNVGGEFTIQVAYDDEFVAPETLDVDAVAGGATATILLATNTNADSQYTFNVTEFLIDDEAAPEGSTAHIQANKSVATSVLTDGEPVASEVELHFGAPDATGDHGDHEGDHGDDHSDHSDEGGHFHWETATITVAIQLVPDADETFASDVHELVITVTNTDMDSMPHDDHGDEHGDEGGDETNFLPGFELIALVGALGIAVVVVRRQ